MINNRVLSVQDNSCKWMFWWDYVLCTLRNQHPWIECERGSAVKGPPQRKMQKEVKISKPDCVRWSIRIVSVWKAAECLKACGTFRNFQSTVEIRDVGWIKLHWFHWAGYGHLSAHTCVGIYACRAVTKCTLNEWTGSVTEGGSRGTLCEWTSPVTESGILWKDHSLHGGTSSVPGLELSPFGSSEDLPGR
jgi:hypothetical protein